MKRGECQIGCSRLLGCKGWLNSRSRSHVIAMRCTVLEMCTAGGMELSGDERRVLQKVGEERRQAEAKAKVKRPVR